MCVIFCTACHCFLITEAYHTEWLTQEKDRRQAKLSQLSFLYANTYFIIPYGTLCVILWKVATKGLVGSVEILQKNFSWSSKRPLDNLIYLSRSVNSQLIKKLLKVIKAQVIQTMYRFLTSYLLRFGLMRFHRVILQL
jgi:hypothetical protein